MGQTQNTQSQAPAEKTTGPDVSREIFGGILEYDNAGFYPGLELLNFIFCAKPFLPGDGEQVQISRRSHDFARRLVWDPGFVQNDRCFEVLADAQSAEAIRHLLQCIQLSIPNLKGDPAWHRAHFFPYTKSLIHWDARNKKGDETKTGIERKYMRGAGALVYRVICNDPDQSRKERIKTGLSNLYDNSDSSSLENLAAVLLSKGMNDLTPRSDEVEAEKTEVFGDDTDELFRDGVANILEHLQMPSVSRVKALINWTGFCQVIMQHNRASKYLGEEPKPVICDCGAGRPQLRRASQRALRDFQAKILEAVDMAAEGKQLAKKQRERIRGFFWATAAAIGLLNAWTGRRHFTLGIDLLETNVMAATQCGAQLSYERFLTDWLYGRCGLVIGREAAQESGLLNDFDASIFEENSEQLAVQMQASGLLEVYSDATRMVGIGGVDLE